MIVWVYQDNLWNFWKHFLLEVKHVVYVVMEIRLGNYVHL